MTTRITSYQDGAGPARGGGWGINNYCQCDNSGLAKRWSGLVPGSFRQFYLGGNVNGGNYVITPGQWYRIELYFRLSTGDIHSDNPDGTIRWWVNGTLVGDYNNVRTGASGSGLEAVEVEAKP